MLETDITITPPPQPIRHNYWGFHLLNISQINPFSFETLATAYLQPLSLSPRLLYQPQLVSLLPPPSVQFILPLQFE